MPFLIVNNAIFQGFNFLKLSFNNFKLLESKKIESLRQFKSIGMNEEVYHIAVIDY